MRGDRETNKGPFLRLRWNIIYTSKQKRVFYTNSLDGFDQVTDQ